MQKEVTYKALDYAPFGFLMPSRSFSGASGYKFGYQGSEKDFDVNQGAYTTHFRMLDTRLGRWFSTDPVFQPWQSSYTSMDNNPIWFNDVLGNVVDGDTGGKKLYNDLKSDVAGKKAGTISAINTVTNTINKLESLGKKQGKIDKLNAELIRLNNRVDKLNDIQKEFNELEKSEQVYFINTGTNTKDAGGFLGYDNETENITINVSASINKSILPNFRTSLKSVLSHELKHASQFENGKISLINGGGGGVLYDLQDEVEAYTRQQFLYGDYGFSVIDASFVENLGYDGIKYRINQLTLDTKAGKGTMRESLIKSIKSNKSDGVKPEHIFIGWQKHYK